MQPDFAEALTKSGKVRVGKRPIIAHVGVGLGNRIDSPAYDISTVEEFRKTLLDAGLLVFDRVKSGQAFAKVLDRLGIAETLKPGIVRTTPGIKLLGPLPGDFQSTLTHAAVLMTDTAQPATAERFIRFLISPKAKEAFAASGAK